MPSLPAFPPENRLPPEKNQSRGLEISPLHRFREGKCRDLVGGGGLRFPPRAETPAFSFFSHRIYNRDEEVDPGPSDPKGESFSGRGGGREEVSPRLLLPPPITSNPVVVFVFIHSRQEQNQRCFFCSIWNVSSPSLPSTLVVDFGTFCINS